MKKTNECLRGLCDFVSISRKPPLSERMFSAKGAGLGPKKQYLVCSTNKWAINITFLLYGSTKAVPPSALAVSAALMQNGTLVRNVINMLLIFVQSC